MTLSRLCLGDLASRFMNKESDAISGMSFYITAGSATHHRQRGSRYACAISGMSFSITAGSVMHRDMLAWVRSVVCLFILLLDQRCTAGSAGVGMRPDGHAGLGPEGHCDMYAHLGSNVCRRRNDLLAFVQQPKSSLLLISLHEPNTKPLHASLVFSDFWHEVRGQ